MLNFNFFLFNTGAENVTANYQQVQVQNIDGQLYTLEAKKHKGRHVLETATYERDIVIRTYHKDKPSLHRSIWENTAVEW